MKLKLTLINLLLMLAMVAWAQDVIVKRDGSTILAKVLEIGETNIKYKKFKNPNGPTYTVTVANVQSVNYENGEKDTFGKQPLSGDVATNQVQIENNNEPKLIKKEPDARNAEIIRLYNRNYGITKDLRRNNDVAKCCYLIWGMGSSSIVSNEDIELKIVSNYDLQYADDQCGQPVYYINLTNKLDKTIYVDRGNCFKIIDNGNSYCYYDPSMQTTVSQGSGSGASIGLGSVAGALGIGGTIGQLASGISVGGGSSSSLATTYSQQRFIAIPPHANRNLSEHKVINGEIVEHAEYFTMSSLAKQPKRGIVKKGQVLSYDENNSPWKRKYIITYSTDAKFMTYSTLQTEVYVQNLIGSGLHGDSDWTRFFSKYIEGWNESTINSYNRIFK